MYKKVLQTAGVLSLLAALPNTAHAGAWTAKQGDTYLKGALNYFDTSSRFGEEGTFENFRNQNFNVYFEYGVQDNLTFFATGSLTDLENRADGVETSNTGVGDIELGLRYRLIDGPVIVSLQGLFKAPYLYSENAELPLGNGQEDYEGKILFGSSFGPLGYGGLELGYRLRSDAPVDEFRFLVEYGFDVSEQVYLRTKLDGIHAVQSSDVADVAGPVTVPGGGPFGGGPQLLPDAQSLNPQLPLEFDLGRIEYTAGYKFGGGLAAEITGTTAIYGDNTLRGTNIQVALVASF